MPIIRISQARKIYLVVLITDGDWGQKNEDMSDAYTTLEAAEKWIKDNPISYGRYEVKGLALIDGYS
jgi:hypothetical protein